MPSRHLAACVSIAVCLFAIAPANSQPADRSQTADRTLEVVIVTAQKRDQDVQDVPISISLVGRELVERAGIRELEDLSQILPAFMVTEAAISTLVFVRGLGSGINQGFEQSVGMYVDNLYFSRPRQYRIPFLDIDRVELLRGPQSILFGKNTIAGAINISTANPTDQLEGYVRGEYSADAGEQNLTAAISGPLSDRLGARIAVGRSSFDGYVYNSFTQRDEYRSDDSAARGTLLWRPSDALTINAKFDHTNFDVDGRIIQITEDGGAGFLFQAFDPLFEDRLDENKSMGGLGPDVSETSVSNSSVSIDYRFGDFTLSSVSGYSSYEYLDNLDVDFGPIPLLYLREPQDFDQWSQEIRVVSPRFDSFEYIVGAYLDGSDLKNYQQVDADLRTLIPTLPPATRVIDFDQETKTWALFGQATWYLRDRLGLSVGLRYTEVDKDATQNLDWVDFRADTINPILGIAYGTIGFGVPHVYASTRSEENLSPSISLQYQLNDDVMIYGSAVRGYKSGGFNAAEQSANIGRFEYGDETSTAVEFGMKSLLANGAARLDIALFHVEFDDAQVSTFDGVDFVVGNAAASTSKGIEVDGAYRLTPRVTFDWSWSYLDSKFDSFANATCTIAQSIQSGLGPLCVQDLAGRATQYSPRNSGRIGLAYERETDRGRILLSGSVFHSDGYYTDQDLDRATYQSAFERVDLRLGWESRDGDWTAAILARNVTDERTISRASDVPLIPGAYFAMMDRPRNVALQVGRYFQ